VLHGDEPEEAGAVFTEESHQAPFVGSKATIAHDTATLAEALVVLINGRPDSDEAKVT
jgi:hypothetical protein